MKFNAVAAAVSAAMLTGAANAEEVQEGPVPDLPKFTVSFDDSDAHLAVCGDGLNSSVCLPPQVARPPQLIQTADSLSPVAHHCQGRLP